MGIFATVLNAPKTFSQRSRVFRQLTELGAKMQDPALGAEFEASDEIALIQPFNDVPNGGNYSIDFELHDGTFFRVGPFAFTAVVDTMTTGIQDRVDAAAALVVDGYTPGDILIEDADDLDAGLLTDALLVTFSGSLAGGKHVVRLDDSNVRKVAIAITTPGNGSSTAQVQTITEYVTDPAGGSFVLDFNLTGDDGPISFTANIPWNATAAQMEAAVDAAAVGSGFLDWDGEIAFSDGDDDDETLETASITMTMGNGLLLQYANHQVTVARVESLDLVLVANPAVTVSASGQTDRPSMAILYAMGILTGAVPGVKSGEVPTAGPNLLRVQPALVAELAQEAASEDNDRGTYESIVSLLPANSSPLVVG